MSKVYAVMHGEYGYPTVIFSSRKKAQKYIWRFEYVHPDEVLPEIFKMKLNDTVGNLSPVFD